MATGQVRVTDEALIRMASKLRQSAEDIMALKSQMDQALNGFLWEDPVGIRFKTVQYPEGFKPLQEILIPDIHELVNRINMIGQTTDMYSEDNGFLSGAGDGYGYSAGGGGGYGNSASAGGGYGISAGAAGGYGDGTTNINGPSQLNPIVDGRNDPRFQPYNSSNETNIFKDL